MKKNLTFLFAAISLVCLLLKQGYTLSDATREELKIYMGTTKTISVSNPTRIAIGNPLIADVLQVSKKDMTIAPKAAGTTTLVYWDNFGEQSFIVKVYNDNTQELKVRIDNALSKFNIEGVTTKAEDEEGKIFLLGRFNSTGERDRAFLAMGPLKDKVVDLTTIKEDESIIEIDVQVLELNKGATDKLGFTWPGSINLTEVAGTPPALAGGTNSWAKIFDVARMTRDAYSLKLDALVQEGKARVLSRPRLACLSGKEAKLLVGGEVPILSSSVVGGGTSGTAATPGSVEYKEYGIKLNIKPTVKENGRIYLNLGIEVSEVGTAVSTSYALAYPFTKRTANTELYLDDGQTMAIGGLIKQKTEEELRKMPWLADVPVLGLFFRQRSTTEGDGYNTRGDSELFITLTPKIVSETKEIKEVKKEVKENKNVKPKKEVVLPAVEEAKLTPLAKYTKIVQKRISDAIVYPEGARNSNFQGTVRLDVKLSYKGEFLDAKVKNSSGYKILDDNALRAAKNQSPYPPFPPTIKSEELWIEIPVAYKLD